MNNSSILISKKLAESIPAVAIRLEKNCLIVGLPDSFTEIEIDEALEELVKEINITVEAQLIPVNIITQAIKHLYNPNGNNENTLPSSVNPKSEGATIELVNRLLESAVNMRASDIHIEPHESDLHIRFRIDGRLENIAIMSDELGPAIASRIKVLSKLSIVERRKPQDGQFSVKVGEIELDVRVSTIATLYGEKIELRLLDTHRNLAGLSSLGMTEDRLEKLTKMLRAGQGMLISAGPTGSGKSTTMHSALQIVNSPELNVSTIEDPVEYVVKGVNHVPVNESIGLTFATQLRALLRQDPDVVLLGEIRDAETAKIAVQASLAGRLVLTSLHAPNALGAIFRLFQMGIEPYQVAASLVGVISQRLVRRNCVFCIEIDQISSSTKTYIQNATGVTKLNLLKGKGCSLCRNTGYFDRIGAFQLFEINESVREVIAQRPSPTQLESISRKFGLTSLQEETLQIAALGVSSISEVMGLDFEIE